MFVNKTLVEAETCYLLLEKAVLAIIHVVQRLPHYFQAHAIVVLTEHPLQALLRRSDFTRRIAKCGGSLGAFDIQYRPRTSIKGQVLANFVAKFTTRQAEVLLIKGSRAIEPWEQIW